jgi:aminopeptidase N
MEPYSAHKVFPCFDQPDLKAPLSLSMIMPKGWVGVANGSVDYENDFTEADYILRTPSIVETQVLKDYLQGRTGYFYVYDRTEPISTYLYCLVAGEYV